MPAGMEAYDSAGRLIFDTSTKLTRLLAVVGTGLVNGSYNAGALPYNYYVAWPTKYTGGVPPKVWMSGTTAFWDFGTTPPEFRSAATLLILGY